MTAAFRSLLTPSEWLNRSPFGRRVAQGFGHWKQGQDPDVLDAYPAKRFIRVHSVRKPRPYHQAAIGQVRRKDDLKFWISLNRDFKVPWGPFGFNSGAT